MRENTQRKNDVDTIEDDPTRSYLNRLMAAGGYILLSVSAVLVGLVGWRYSQGQQPYRIGEDQGVFVFFLQHYAYETILLLGATILGHFALRLLFGANQDTVEVIPAKDRQLLEPLIKEGNKEAINQYVILSSLSGFTGTFQKIGFSGLPLATVGLTLVFSILSFLKPEFLELAKLTLGAFIGSFVQKGRDELQRAKESNKSTR